MNIHCLVVSKEEIKKRKGFDGADWWIDENGDLQVRVEQLSNDIRTTCLQIHEIVEGALAKLRGTTVQSVDEFDKHFDENTPERRLSLEAGDAEGCPYAIEHSIAICCERAVFSILNGGSWASYDEELENL